MKILSPLAAMAVVLGTKRKREGFYVRVLIYSPPVSYRLVERSQNSPIVSQVLRRPEPDIPQHRSRRGIQPGLFVLQVRQPQLLRP